MAVTLLEVHKELLLRGTVCKIQVAFIRKANSFSPRISLPHFRYYCGVRKVKVRHFATGLITCLIVPLFNCSFVYL